MMKLVKNDKEFEKLYPYSESDPKKCRHPKKYPCLIEWEWQEGGLGGSYYSCYVIYLDNNKSSFIDGVNAVKKTLIECH